MPDNHTETGTPDPCGDTYEPDNTIAQAHPIALGATQQRAFCVPGDKDWVSFAAQADARYRIETSTSRRYGYLPEELYDHDGITLIAEDDDSNGNLAWLIEQTITQSNTYYVKIRHYSAASGNPGATYNLHISLVADDPTPTSTPEPCADAYEPDDTRAQAHAITLNVTEPHAFCVPADMDWVSFTAQAGNRYRIETLNLAPNVDTYLELYDQDGVTVLAADDNGNGNDNSLINHYKLATTSVLYQSAAQSEHQRRA